MKEKGIDRKNKTIKQLQAEMRRRKIGFMMNWTKAALIKRLLEEDTRERDLLDTNEKLERVEKERDSVLPDISGKIKLELERVERKISKLEITWKQLDSQRTSALEKYDRVVLEREDLKRTLLTLEKV
jgi:chromosome segregation ATPase